jgi:hypothetical protein
LIGNSRAWLGGWGWGRFPLTDRRMPVNHTPDMERTSLFFPKQQMDRLKKLAKKTDTKVAELIRRAVEEFLKREGQ